MRLLVASTVRLLVAARSNSASIVSVWPLVAESPNTTFTVFLLYEILVCQVNWSTGCSVFKQCVSCVWLLQDGQTLRELCEQGVWTKVLLRSGSRYQEHSPSRYGPNTRQSQLSYDRDTPDHHHHHHYHHHHPSTGQAPSSSADTYDNAQAKR